MNKFYVVYLHVFSEWSSNICEQTKFIGNCDPIWIWQVGYNNEIKKKLLATNNFLFWLKSEYRPSRMMFVYKIQVNTIDTILKYGIYYDFMDR